MPDEAVTHTSTTSSDSEVVYSVSSDPTRTPAAAVGNKITIVTQCSSGLDGCVYMSNIENCKVQKIQVDKFLTNAKVIRYCNSV